MIFAQILLKLEEKEKREQFPCRVKLLSTHNHSENLCHNVTNSMFLPYCVKFFSCSDRTTAGSNCATQMSAYTQYCSQSLVMNIKKYENEQIVILHIYIQMIMMFFITLKSFQKLYTELRNEKTLPKSSSSDCYC